MERGVLCWCIAVAWRGGVVVRHRHAQGGWRGFVQGSLSNMKKKDALSLLVLVHRRRRLEGEGGSTRGWGQEREVNQLVLWV